MFESDESGTIGPYRIVRRLGGGEAADVLLATRTFLGDFERRVVIKRLRKFGDRPADEQHVLATEAVAYARVAHPAIVQLFDFFAERGELALVLEYVDGLSLAGLLDALRARGERLGDRPTLYLASRVFAALAAAHSARDPATGRTTPVIHRDVNPANVLVPWDGFVKLGDFDLAKVVGVSTETRSGLMKGTYGYMAPEQVRGETVTPRTDVYAATLMLREMLLGRPAFDRALPELELLRAMEEARHPRIESLRGGLSPRLAGAMARGLARDPVERTLGAGEMVETLRAETDMEAAHAELIAVLARVKAGELRGTDQQRALTPEGVVAVRPDSVSPMAQTMASAPVSSRRRADHPTPRSMMVSIGRESIPTMGTTLPPDGRNLRARLAGAIAVAATVGGLGAAYVATLLRAASSDADDARAYAAPSDEATSPTLTVDAAVPTSPRAPVVARPAPVVTSAKTGELRTPASSRKHRVFVDGKVAAWESGETLRLSCGPHVVRIGSHGATQVVQVPCGGSVLVEAK